MSAVKLLMSITMNASPMEYFLYPPEYEARDIGSLKNQRVSIINAGYVCSYVEKTLYLFFGKNNQAVFVLSFNDFENRNQLQMAFKQISNLMTRQEESVYAYSVEATSPDASGIVFKTGAGEEIMNYISHTYFDGYSVRGARYSDHDGNGYHHVQTFINSIIQRSTPLNRFSIISYNVLNNKFSIKQIISVDKDQTSDPYTLRT